jgi:hypothetical protein
LADTIEPPLTAEAIQTDADRGAGVWVSVWCVVAAFGAYFCMYGFRKPFTAAGYDAATLWGLDYKTLLVVAQVLGYTVSKFLGIKVVAETPPARRAATLLGLIAAAWATLLLFGLTPPPWGAVWLFGNGLMLGMVFGLVLGFLEGRRHTEALAAGLCASFIVADGVTKSVGAALLDAGISDRWMPFLAGLLFALPLLGFAWMLTHVPDPSPQDVAERSERLPMDGSQRWTFFRRYAGGLSLVVLIYLLVTILRSVRADFAPEIWQGLQGIVRPRTFALSEFAVAAAVLLLTGAMVVIRDNRRAFFSGLGLAGVGVAIAGVALAALSADAMEPFAFMVLLGVGLYLPYLVVHTTLFERLLAGTRERGNIGYLMYLADSFGYLGYVAVLLARVLFGPADDFLSFFVATSWVVVGGCLLLLVPCWLYFAAYLGTQRKGGEA